MYKRQSAGSRGAFIDALEDIVARASPSRIGQKCICATNMFQPAIPRGAVLGCSAAALRDGAGCPDDVVATDPAGVGEVNGVCGVIGTGINQLPSYGVAIQQVIVSTGQIRCFMGISGISHSPINPVSGIGGGCYEGQRAECDE